jgi:paired amphipathic helix protein Sin3a
LSYSHTFDLCSHALQSQVYAQVQDLFKDAPDLLSEFKNFLPDAGFVPRSGQQHGSSWAQADIPISADKAGKRVSSSARRRKRPAEKDITPAPPVRIAPNRVNHNFSCLVIDTDTRPG